jgi:RNA polymerase sigma factor (sigma-70 family)
VLGWVRDEAAAEDIVHDVLVRASARRDTLRDRGKLGQWLYQIARNAIIDLYRRCRPTEELPDEMVDEEVYASGDAEKELARCLTPFIEELPAHYRQAVMLAELQGFTQREGGCFEVGSVRIRSEVARPEGETDARSNVPGVLPRGIRRPGRRGGL